MILTIAAALTCALPRAEACTGITLRAADGSLVQARTIEWGGGPLHSEYIVVPRGHLHKSYLPDAARTGLEFRAEYGYVALSIEQPEFVADGVNEAGLEAGYFYYPHYGSYLPYDASQADITISDMQVAGWLLATCGTVAEAREALRDVRIVGLYPDAGAVHWRVSDASGAQIVIEIEEGVTHIYDNEAGVLTNAPGFGWQMTNLRNYVNLHSGAAPPHVMDGITLAPFGAGSGTIGLPGDVTPPSRFVRAFFYKASAPVLAGGFETVMQAFVILNNFDIPIGIEYAAGEPVPDLPSATQWTVAIDQTARRVYYRTAYDSSIRCIDLAAIDFAEVKYTAAPLDKVRRQPVEYIKVR